MVIVGEFCKNVLPKVHLGQRIVKSKNGIKINQAYWNPPVCTVDFLSRGLVFSKTGLRWLSGTTPGCIKELRTPSSQSKPASGISPTTCHWPINMEEIKSKFEGNWECIKKENVEGFLEALGEFDSVITYSFQRNFSNVTTFAILKNKKLYIELFFD